MRNLKKVLSLSLAFVMLLGMMVVGGSAVTADFNDAADVSYTEAVDVMSTIGVFNGDENGDFDPTGNLTREQAAKIITYMMVGKSSADKLGASTAPFNDVAADRWSAGSIAYCVTMGILAGNGDGNFDPTANVTGYAFAKMLLTALGYDAKIQGYVNNASWTANVNKDALSAGLLSGLNLVLSNNLTREEAAQMACNALSANLVYHELQGTEISLGDTTIVVGASAPAAVTDSTLSSRGNIDADANDTIQFAEKHFRALVWSPASSNYGRPAYKWSYYGDTIGIYEYAPTFVYTAEAVAGPAYDALVKDLKFYDFTTYAPLAEVNAKGTITVDEYDDVAGLTGNGRVVEVYTDAYKRVFSVNVIDTALVQIEKIDTEKNTVELSDVAGNWTIAKVDEYNRNLKTLMAMEEEDYVLITANTADATNYTVVTVEEPTVVTGTVSYAKTTGPMTSITVNGESYNLSFAQINLTGLDADVSEKYNVYLDRFGNAMWTDTISLTDPDVIYVMDVYQGVGANGKLTNMVEGVLRDGTVVNLEVAYDSTVSYLAMSTAGGNSDGSDVAYNYVPSISYPGYKFSPAGVDSDGKGIVVNGDTNLITAGTRKNTTDGKYYAENVKTIYVTSATGAVKVVDGLPVGTSLDNTDDYIVYSIDEFDNVVVSAVYVQGAYTAVEDLIFVSRAEPTNGATKVGTNGQTLYGFNVYANGKDTTIYRTANTNIGAGAAFYNYSIDDASGAYNLTSYAGGNVSTSESVTLTYVGGHYYLTGCNTANGWDEYTADDAVVADADGNMLTNVNSIAKLLKEGSCNVAVIVNTDTHTIEMIYFLG